MLRLKAELDVSRLHDLAGILSAHAISEAWRRTLRKTGNWIKTHVARQLAGSSKVPQRVIKQRIYFFLRSQREGKVWLGLNPLDARRLGRARQTAKGVTVGRHRFPGAWTMRYRDPLGVYRRTGNYRSVKRLIVTDSKEYWVKQRREAYEEVMVPWDAVAERVFRQVAAQAEQRLLTILEQELRWELRKAGA